MMKKIFYISLLVFWTNFVQAQTRFYLPATGTAGLTPAISSTWNNTSNNLVRPMATTTTGTSMSSNTGSVPNVAYTLFAQYVSEPLAAQTISGTVKGQIRSQLNNVSGATCSTAVTITVVNSSGTIVATLLNATAGNATLTTTLTNRTSPPSTSLTSYACADGDRIVVEIGIRRTAGTTSRNGTISMGDNSGTDLPENNTTTTANNPWIQFSQDLTFWEVADQGNFFLIW